jgi:putative endonuclease
MPIRLLEIALDFLGRLAHLLPWGRKAQTRAHLATGRRGETDAYFHLRRQGYVIVARNFRSRRRRGEIDLVGWDGDMLCFIEVKTRTSREVKPPEAAVDQEKRRELAAMAREYCRRSPRSGQRDPLTFRFDIVSVYYESPTEAPQIVLFKNAFTMT